MRRSLYVALALAVGLPTLGVGLTSADLHAIAVLEGRLEARGVSAIYGDESAACRDTAQGTFAPWWVADDAPRRYSRPLSALTLAWDHALFGLDARGYHATSIAIFVLVVLAVARFFRSLAPPDAPRALVPLATLWFALAHAHAASLAVITDRHTMLSAGLGVVAWQLARERRRALSWAMLAAALAASETIAPIAVVIAIDAALRRDSDVGAPAVRAAPARERALDALGPLALVGAFALLAVRSGIDLSPGPIGGDASPFARGAVMLGALAAPLRPERLESASGGEMLAVASAMLLAALGARAWPIVRASPGARSAAIALAVYAPVLALVRPTSGALWIASAAFAYLAAAVVLRDARAGLVARSFVVPFAIVHLVLAPALGLRTVGRIRERTARAERAAERLPRDADARVLLLTSPVGTEPELPLRARVGGSASAIWVLSLSRESHGLWHPDERTVGLSGELLRHPHERPGRPHATWQVGSRAQRGALRVEVHELGVDHVAFIALRTDVVPEQVTLLVRDGDGWSVFALPELGGAITLPRADEADEPDE
ncbi:MAG: hypothetical protein AB7S26_25760 [Sandaracinaceae bacterium]